MTKFVRILTIFEPGPFLHGNAHIFEGMSSQHHQLTDCLSTAPHTEVVKLVLHVWNGIDQWKVEDQIKWKGKTTASANFII